MKIYTSLEQSTQQEVSRRETVIAIKGTDMALRLSRSATDQKVSGLSPSTNKLVLLCS